MPGQRSRRMSKNGIVLSSKSSSCCKMVTFEGIIMLFTVLNLFLRFKFVNSLFTNQDRLQPPPPTPPPKKNGTSVQTKKATDNFISEMILPLKFCLRDTVGVKFALNQSQKLLKTRKKNNPVLERNRLSGMTKSYLGN